jgi:hypothetical protein
MKNKARFLAAVALCIASSKALAGNGSTITFGRSDQLQVTKGKKLNFKQDIEAVIKAHDSWKKAHLSEALYSCQRNPETEAKLARKVSDRMEVSKKDAIASAKAIEGVVNSALGANATDVPDTLDENSASTLRAKADQLKKAKIKADLLESLSSKVMHFYENEMPKESAVDGDCISQYQNAFKKAVETSEEYHEDSAALSQKIDKLAKMVETAWRNAAAREMVAKANP